MPMTYCGYEASRTKPNLVVDGSPNEGTVLTLTHWPGYPPPPELAADLSAEIAFNYIDHHMGDGESPDADVVTTNHFDQDGLVSIHALVKPEESMAHRALLIDLAAAGDFATYSDRRAARASMTFSRMAEREMTCEYDEFTDQLIIESLPMVLPVLLDGDRFKEHWADEDEDLTRCEAAVADGRISIDEHVDIDLAVVTVPDDFVSSGGHRFGGESFGVVHPMAVNNAVDRFRMLIVHGRRYRYVDRYETWVQYQTRRPAARVDMRPLAELLTSKERGPEVWTSTGPGSLTPEMTHTGESTLRAGQVLSLLNQHLRSQPAAWDPYVS